MHSPILSETEPTNVYTGKIWIRPSTAQAYMRMGQIWSPLGSSSGGITFKNITVFIDGQDKTSLVEKNTLSIEDILTREVNTCSFSILDETNDFKPEVGQEVVIFYKETTSSTPVLEFAGKIEEVPQTKVGIGIYRYELTCMDYTQELNRQLVVETYTSQTAGDIIKDIIDNYAPGLGASVYVQDGVTVDYIAFNYKYPMECITEIAELIGYDWYVDYDRQVHFFASDTNDAPYDINETATSGDYKDLEIFVHKSELKNIQVVRGGYEFSALYTQEEVADGTQESFPYRYTPYTPLSVYVDTGGGYVQKTLGIDNIDTSGYDFVYNSAEKTIKNLDLAILTAGHKIKLTYKYKKPILAYVDDETSIQLMVGYEGGDGKYEAPLIIDDSIETKDQARARGQAELTQYSNPLVEGSFTTTQYGYKSGQILTIDIPTRGYNDRQYLIQQVTAISLGMGNFEYQITFASLLKGLIDYLIQLHKDSRKEFTRTDEILDRLKIIATEAIQVGDSGLGESRRNTTASSYKWSNDGGTTTGKGQYNLASWG